MAANKPAVYELLITLKNDQDQVVEVLRQEVGFRRVEIKGNTLLVNGEYIYLKGANLHEHHEVTGHVMDEATMLEDIRIMKMHNLNAVRLPLSQTNSFELCNRYGLCILMRPISNPRNGLWRTLLAKDSQEGSPYSGCNMCGGTKTSLPSSFGRWATKQATSHFDAAYDYLKAATTIGPYNTTSSRRRNFHSPPCTPDRH